MAATPVDSDSTPPKSLISEVITTFRPSRVIPPLIPASSRSTSPAILRALVSSRPSFRNYTPTSPDWVTDETLHFIKETRPSYEDGNRSPLFSPASPIGWHSSLDHERTTYSPAYAPPPPPPPPPPPRPYSPEPLPLAYPSILNSPASPPSSPSSSPFSLTSPSPPQCYPPPQHLPTKPHITSLDFDDSGELAILSRSDETLQIYNTHEGRHAKELKSQKYGVHLARFTHHAQSIIYASTKGDDNIRYLSTHDNSFIRYFRGHTAPVTCLALCPSNDTFLSCSLDNTVRLWDLHSSSPQGQLNLHGAYLAAYDPSASVIAIASAQTSRILMYDLRNYDKPPFAEFDIRSIEQRYLPKSVGAGWTKIEFSNNGKYLLVATSGTGHFVLDAFEGQLVWFCAREKGTNRLAPGESLRDTTGKVAMGQGDCGFTPDGRYLVGGQGASSSLLVWDMETKGQQGEKYLKACSTLEGDDARMGSQAVVGFNPVSNVVVSADREVVMWLPDRDLLP